MPISSLPVAIGVLVAFVIYSAIIWRWSHHWRPWALWVEFVIGALLIVIPTHMAAQPGWDWQTYQQALILHYCIAALVVVPCQIAQVARDGAESRRRQQEPPHAA